LEHNALNGVLNESVAGELESKAELRTGHVKEHRGDAALFGAAAEGPNDELQGILAL
jgi:hypothetical protein